MTDEQLVEAVARALARADGLDYDEICGVDAEPDEGYCDSDTCVAVHWEEHDAEQARRWWLHLARAIIPLVREAERADVVNDLRRLIKSGERIDGMAFMGSQLAVLANHYERGDHTQESQP